MFSKEILESEFAPYFSSYIKLVNQGSLIEELEISLYNFIQFVQNVPIDKFDYQYAVGKWTIKDIIQHIIDVERIFAYRALRISRNDKTPLHGFEEDDYVTNTMANKRTIQDLLSEFAAVRQATILLFKSFSHEQMLRIGTASNNKISVRAIGFIVIGHTIHHQNIFMERYL